MKLNIPISDFETSSEQLREVACILESIGNIYPDGKVSGTLSVTIETDGDSPPIAQVIPVPESMWGADLRSKDPDPPDDAPTNEIGQHVNPADPEVPIPYSLTEHGAPPPPTPTPPPTEATPPPPADPPIPGPGVGTPPPPPADVPLDKEGQAWDENLHAKNKSKTMQGTWKKKRGSIAKQPPAITVAAVQAAAGQLVLKGVATERINTIIAQAGTGDPMAVQIAGTDGLAALPLLTAEELGKVWKAMHAEATLIGVAL